jgi:hypothetical protein
VASGKPRGVELWFPIFGLIVRWFVLCAWCYVSGFGFCVLRLELLALLAFLLVGYLGYEIRRSLLVFRRQKLRLFILMILCSMGQRGISLCCYL